MSPSAAPAAWGEDRAEAFRWLYRGYLLDCAPVAGLHGRYTPRLSVRSVGAAPGPGVSVMLSECTPFRLPGEAARFALAEGTAWIDALL